MTLTPEALGMAPHPEGGWYREGWRHETTVETPRGPRALVSSVAFLLLPGERSAWHRVTSPELWLWQGGGPVHVTVGGYASTPEQGATAELHEGGQYLVHADEWQTAVPGTDEPTLVACIVSPGFDFADFTLAEQPEHPER